MTSPHKKTEYSTERCNTGSFSPRSCFEKKHLVLTRKYTWEAILVAVLVFSQLFLLYADSLNSIDAKVLDMSFRKTYENNPFSF